MAFYLGALITLNVDKSIILFKYSRYQTTAQDNIISCHQMCLSGSALATQTRTVREKRYTTSISIYYLVITKYSRTVYRKRNPQPIFVDLKKLRYHFKLLYACAVMYS